MPGRGLLPIDFTLLQPHVSHPSSLCSLTGLKHLLVKPLWMSLSHIGEPKPYLLVSHAYERYHLQPLVFARVRVPLIVHNPVPEIVDLELGVLLSFHFLFHTIIRGKGSIG